MAKERHVRTCFSDELASHTPDFADGMNLVELADGSIGLRVRFSRGGIRERTDSSGVVDNPLTREGKSIDGARC